MNVPFCHRLASEWARRAKRERRHAASRNPLKALAARTDLRQEYIAQPLTVRDQMLREKSTLFICIHIFYSSKAEGNLVLT